MSIICVRCGNVRKVGEIQGSLVYPLCKKCFKKNFKNYEEYRIFLNNRGYK